LATFIDYRQKLVCHWSVVSCPSLPDNKVQQLLSTFNKPSTQSSTSLPCGNHSTKQIHSGRAAGTRWNHRVSSSIANRQSPADELSLSHQQQTTNNEQPTLQIHQSITGHFRQKGARRHLPDPVNPSSFRDLGFQFDPDGKTGVFKNPFYQHPAWVHPGAGQWVGVADGLQAIPNPKSQI